MLDERALADELEELVARDKVVVFAVLLAGAGLPRGVWRRDVQSQGADRSAGCSRDTLNPNLSGNSAKRRWSRVLLPTPDGPDMTKGRRKSGRGDMAGRAADKGATRGRRRAAAGSARASWSKQVASVAAVAKTRANF